MNVETMYGVCHGGLDAETCCSPELKQDLESLPIGTTVGIEYAKELNTEQIRGIVTYGLGYWRELERLFESLGLKPIYLDDAESLKRVGKLFREKELQRILLRRHLERDGNFQRTREIKEALFKAKTEEEYVASVVRQDKIIENILRYQPQVVIVGQLHADLIMFNLDTLNKKGLTVGAYLSENIDPQSCQMYSIGSRRFLTTLQKGIPNPFFLRERESQVRKHSAVTLGRVLHDRLQRPDYIGTWKPECRWEGLFEMSVRQRSGTEFNGIIEDTAGTASFEGKLTDDSMEFVKRYDPLKSIDGLTEDILYVGHMKNGVFVGTFQTGVEKYPFYLNTGDRLQDCEIY